MHAAGPLALWAAAQVAAQATQGAGGVVAARSLIQNASAQAQSAQQQAEAARSAIGQAVAQLRVAQSQVPASLSLSVPSGG